MTSTRAPRRSTAELRALLLRAAEDLFTARGYSATTTKDLAARAGVAESVLFNNFGSKDVLFREVMLNPFVAFLEQFTRRSRRFLDEPLPAPVMTRLFVGELYDLLREHRIALRSLLAAESAMRPEALAALHDSVNKLLSGLGEVVEAEARQRELEPRASTWEHTFRTCFGMLLAAAILDDWIMPPEGLARDQMVDELTRIVMHGFAHPADTRSRGS